MDNQALPPLAEKWVREINEDSYSGAAALTRKMLAAFEDVIRSQSAEPIEKQWACLELMGNRWMLNYPDMASVNHCVHTILKHAQTFIESSPQPTDFAQRALEVVHDYSAVLHNSEREVMRRGMEMLKDVMRVMTISSSSTVKRLFDTAWSIKHPIQVFALESYPGAEGKRFASELQNDTTLVSDMQMMQYLERCDVVIVGADAVSATHFVNKVGTHLLALAAKEADVPFYVLTESQKYTTSRDIKLKKGGLLETTPLTLVTSVITD